jgi:probable HAF family extracellular repeat protein
MRFKCWVCVVATLFTALNSARTNARHQQEQTKQRYRYKLVDIGTFGGPASFVNPNVNEGNALSGRGTAVGSSAIPIPSPATSVACGGLDGTLSFVFHAFRSQDGVVSDLGTLLGDNNCSVAASSNTRGEIVGHSENGVVDPATGIGEFRAVLWKEGGIQDLGTLGGKASSAAQINDRNQITGFAYNTVPDAFTPFGTQIRAFLWEKGHMMDLGTLGGPDVLGTFINDRGQIAGLSLTDSVANASTGIPTQDPFLWSKDTGMIDIGTLGGVAGGPSALNNRGQVIGNSNLTGDQVTHPFFWDDGMIIDLNTATVGGGPLTANALNDAGEVVGTADFPNGAGPHAYLWKAGVAKDLGTLPGDCFSEAFAINAKAQVVGQSINCDTQIVRTFLWDNGNMIDLNTFVPPGSGLQLVEAVAINDQGEIAGDLVPPDCGGGIIPTQGNDLQCGHAFVLIPCSDEVVSSSGECRDAAQVAEEPTPARPSGLAATQTTLTPTQIRDRARAFLAKRNRRFPLLPAK